MIIKKTKAAMPEEGMEAPAEAAPEAARDSAQTAEIPSTIIGGESVEPGDKIQLSVVSVDADSGMITVTYDHEAEPKPTEGSDSMAAEFGEQPQPTV